jgi:hypothetical protein
VLAQLLAALAGELERGPLRAAGQRLPGRGVGVGGLPLRRAGLLQADTGLGQAGVQGRRALRHAHRGQRGPFPFEPL